MTKKEYEIVIRALYEASGLSPEWKDDYYEGLNLENVARFFNGLIRTFNLPNDWYMFHFNNAADLVGDSPSKSFQWFLNHKDLVENAGEGDN